jgi:hypothetical protein
MFCYPVQSLKSVAIFHCINHELLLLDVLSHTTIAAIAHCGEAIKEPEMTSTADRSELGRALAKAVAYRDCGKPEKAATWAAELVRLLEAQAILSPPWANRQPEC